MNKTGIMYNITKKYSMEFVLEMFQTMINAIKELVMDNHGFQNGGQIEKSNVQVKLLQEELD